MNCATNCISYTGILLYLPEQDRFLIKSASKQIIDFSKKQSEEKPQYLDMLNELVKFRVPEVAIGDYMNAAVRSGIYEFLDKLVHAALPSVGTISLNTLESKDYIGDKSRPEFIDYYNQTELNKFDFSKATQFLTAIQEYYEVSEKSKK